MKFIENINSLRRTVFLVIIIFMLIPGKVYVQTTVKLLPAYKEVNDLTEFDIEVHVLNVSDLHAYSISLNFDPGFLRVIDISKGTFLSAVSYSTFFFQDFDNDSGRISIDEAILGAYGVSGAGTLAMIRFENYAGGTCELLISEISLRNCQNEEIAATTIPCTIVSAPVKINLSSFSATRQKNYVELRWYGEFNDVHGFEVERTSHKDGNFMPIGLITKNVSEKFKDNYRFVDEDIESGITYFYRLKILTLAGQCQFSDIISVNVGNTFNFRLSQNYPNPFNSSTNIKYYLPYRTKVSLTIYNIHGEKIYTILNNVEKSGSHIMRWDGRNEAGQQVASGMYICKLTCEGISYLRKITFLK